MNFSKIVTKGIVVSFIFHLLFAVLIVRMDFDVSLANFSVLLMILMAIVSLYVGLISEKMGVIAGTLVSLGTVAILFLYLNQRIEMNWELNRYLIGLYLLNGFVFSFLGSLLKRKSKNKKNKKPKTRASSISTRKMNREERSS